MDAHFGAQTQRAIENFQFSHHRMPTAFIQSLAQIKWCCADANLALGILDQPIAQAIQETANDLIEGQHQDQFPVDVFQTGSGTSSNMNMNEVIANLASQRAGIDVHPNDHVNMSQSSNDVIPTTIHVAAAIQVDSVLLPAISRLVEAIETSAVRSGEIVKTGRTHLMDAMPVSIKQEFSAWKSQLEYSIARIKDSERRLLDLALGGTAVGTGINAPDGFAEIAIRSISVRSGLEFKPMDNKLAGLACQDNVVEMSGQISVLSTALTKIANDLRWMNSGPISGLKEIQLPALQPGSSIMPGKVNPVIPEAVAMACAQVVGNHTTITTAGMSGNFQLNVMLPVIAHNLLESIGLMTASCRSLAELVFKDLVINEEQLSANVARNPILITALNRQIGYEKGAKIAKRAYAENRSVIDVALEETDLDEQTLQSLLDPRNLT